MTTAPPRKRVAKPRDTPPGTHADPQRSNAFPTDDIKPEIPKTEAKADAPKLSSIAGGKSTALKQPLMAMYGTIAFGVGMANPRIGTAILQNAETCAKAWDDLARQNASVKRVLEALTKTTAVGAVLTAHVPIAIAVVGEYRPELLTRFMEAPTMESPFT